MIKTLKQAINNDQLLSWPVIDKLNFGKYIVDTKAIHMGHLDEERQYLQSTKQQSAKKPSHKALEIINTIIPFDAKSMACGNLTGPFPYTSLRGAKYLFILYDYDANTIFAHTLKSKQVHEIKQAWLATTKRLEKHIVSIDGDENREKISTFVNTLPIMDSKFIRNTMADCEPKLDLDRTVVAPSGEKVNVRITFGAEFFRPFF